MTSDGLARAVHSGFCSQARSKQTNMATVEGECAAVLLQLSEAGQTNEDSSSFKNSCPSLQRFNSPEIVKETELSSTTTPKT